MSAPAFPRVAVLGLGLMGGGMARTLLARGFAVTVWNRSPDRARAPELADARIADSPADAARDADMVIAMLADDIASEAVWTGADGALAAMRADAIAIESSTLTIGWVATLARAMAARGIAFLDAPVTGSRDQAATGALKFLIGGDDVAIARARPVLDTLATEIRYLGPTGSGAAMKLVNNFLCGVQVAALAEALALAEGAGIDRAVALDVLAAGAPGSPIVRGVGARMIARDYAPHFLTPLMAKDLGYAIALAEAQGIPLPSARAARALFVLADAAGLGDRDIASVAEVVRDDARHAGE